MDFFVVKCYYINKHIGRKEKNMSGKGFTVSEYCPDFADWY